MAEMSEGGVERRFVPIEVRVEEDAEGRAHIRGYGAVFNQWSEDLGFFTEIIEPGAFSKTLQEADVRSLWNHDVNYVLGRNRAETLRLFEDERGLGYDVVPPDTQWARDLLVSIRRGDVNQSSFGFETIRDVWGQEEDGRVTRRLIEVRLFDVGPVTFPAYPQTSAEARAKARELTSTPGQEAHLEDAEQASAQGGVDLLRRRLDLADMSLTIRLSEEADDESA